MVKKSPKQNDLIYDVGLHKGEDTDYYLKKGFKVVAFEADPELVSLCRKRFADDLRKGNLMIVEGAIVKHEKKAFRDRRVKFYKSDAMSVWGTVCETWKLRNQSLGVASSTIEVPAVNFKACLEKYGIPHYLKIDIEGMDTVCLEALKGFEDKPDYISIESEKVNINGLLEELNLFRQLGYSHFRAVQQCGISRQHEPNPSGEGRYVGYQFQEGSSGLFGGDLPGKWKSHSQILRDYEKIFVLYRYFGDSGILCNKLAGKVLKKVLSFILHKPIPGWFDTHAKL